jgi:hypothetical protein
MQEAMILIYSITIVLCSVGILAMYISNKRHSRISTPA